MYFFGKDENFEPQNSPLNLMIQKVFSEKDDFFKIFIYIIIFFKKN